MKKHNKYAVRGLQALERAAKKVAGNARKNKNKIPIWENGSMKFKIPSIITDQLGKPDRK
ncbi:MAG: hypothetical protein KAI69_06825 [Deltaproteobacteria bacterium]|nr:hypothetical protein [Deltaproteobacteria bacterium]